MTTFTRRQALASTLAAPALLSLTSAARAAAPMQEVTMPKFHRFKLGGFEVNTLLAGSATRDEPQSIFGQNVSAEEFASVSAENFIPTDKVQFYFTPTLVNTGSELILFDTGLNAGGITAAIAAAGYSADQVDAVVLTHMHGDHIGGLSGDAGETFTNARYITGQVEYDHWAGAANERFDGKVKPLAEKMSFLKGGDSVASGVTAQEAFGHTPGHMAYRLESGGKQLMIMADFANHYVWSLAKPDWEVRFDMDKGAAAATRRKMLDMMSADGIPFIGYHMPFPGIGYAQTDGDGYRYVPASYQMLL
ncbi:MBL fold metallo-hydrolase [Actibacterium pelagium]|uniref:MBL fold hydrolase n=1 Tax=Actibacterium pelagium TaxID=2029103 RepID=A0A917EIC9_9RHOB|nr:MBL fold metallo-hydrolase [Actibacterium pelagium]GGE48084.1 MBL fold hydrolase [Actibacterium pelagium]